MGHPRVDASLGESSFQIAVQESTRFLLPL